MDNDRKIEVNKCIELIKKERDIDALIRLHALVGASIKYIAFKFMRNVADAEDLVQDFWADIYEISMRYNFLYNGFNYLCKIMTNRAINRYHKRAGEKSHIDAAADIDADIIASGKTYLLIDDHDFIEDLGNKEMIEYGLSKLSDRQRYIIFETYFTSKTVREIAQDLKVSKSLVSKLKIEAINIMSQAIKEFYDEDE